MGRIYLGIVPLYTSIDLKNHLGRVRQFWSVNSQPPQYVGKKGVYQAAKNLLSGLTVTPD